MGPKAIIGLSVGTPSELTTFTPEVDYLGIGPVFATSTKKDAGKAIGIEGLRELAGQTNLPIVAIGGINSSNARETMEAGVQGVAVVSAICGAPSPYEAAKILYSEVCSVD